MRVFVAGGTGAIGRPLVPRLLAAGHEVTAMTRSEDRAAAVRAAGAEAVVADVFDSGALRSVLAAARPEVVVNELTDIPHAINPRKYEKQMAGLARIRGEGYANLTEAARAAGARRLVAQSIAFVYAPAAEGAAAGDAPGPGGAAPAPGGVPTGVLRGAPAGEEEPLWLDAPEPFAATLRATVAAERTTLDSGLEALVLRYGWFYGPGTSYAADGPTTQMIRKRRYPIVGSGAGVSSFIHVDDAADATVAAVSSSATGVLNVVDDEPARLDEWLPATAEHLGARKPWRVPALVARVAAGSFAVAFSEQQRGAANARAKDALGWAPAHPTWRGTLGT